MQSQCDWWPQVGARGGWIQSTSLAAQCSIISIERLAMKRGGTADPPTSPHPPASIVGAAAPAIAELAHRKGTATQTWPTVGW